ncbi:hypothetical protein ANCCAN_08721 [Ancylostoma caninum]|uniref:Uncharacterized protein n=1 Tax=Ancylostoma caninum TaxID=29170 RepID=A0A368GQM7_ANCCA|nr:hypothetical protein ANCCAN_08721 [Ancylostoma caninum]
MNSIEEVEVRVLFFGKARELMECEETRARIPRVLPYAKLKELIFSKLFGVLDCISASCVLAVDLRFATFKRASTSSLDVFCILIASWLS